MSLDFQPFLSRVREPTRQRTNGSLGCEAPPPLREASSSVSIPVPAPGTSGSISSPTPTDHRRETPDAGHATNLDSHDIQTRIIHDITWLQLIIFLRLAAWRLRKVEMLPVFRRRSLSFYRQRSQLAGVVACRGIISRLFQFPDVAGVAT
ncbi:hypothetical protein MHUMG1_03983 [Metarhizium humberi]|uniref:Uncharacterized protein n=1 Tax=Metarhizium humberi TaxID=2596975 RepID=A0A9P8S8K3_9HYPO|nr:hypothetical protein MHUMG1_03983 [Metarhizium humberi]